MPEDIGCNNSICVEADKCQRQVIYSDGTAREVRKFGGTEAKGCGKFIPKKENSNNR
jgi:hypothetical protein